MTEITRYNVSKTSFLSVGNITKELTSIDFEKMWELHPGPSSVMMYGKMVEVPRFQESYDEPYEFSGTVRPAVTLPEILKPFSEYINTLGFGKFNQKFCNWYINGLSYIGAHRDDERQIIPGTPIVSISLGATRKFRIRCYKTKKIIIDVELIHGMVVIMGGDFQKEFTHEIVKVSGKKGENVGKRINLTFRQFVKEKNIVLDMRSLSENLPQL